MQHATSWLIDWLIDWLMYLFIELNGTPIGNHILRVEWSCDRWRHVTLKDQGRDPKHLIINVLITEQSAVMGQIPRFIESIVVDSSLTQKSKLVNSTIFHKCHILDYISLPLVKVYFHHRPLKLRTDGGQTRVHRSFCCNFFENERIVTKFWT